MKRPRKLAADRARQFVSALVAETRDRPNWWVSIHAVARRAGIPGEDAVDVADECARAGLVSHDQSQATSAERRAAVRPHSVTLNQAGRDLAACRKR